MFVVLFEVQPHAEFWEEYLSVAATLRPELLRIDGFVDNVRYASARTPGRLLSLSTWRDEKALIRWRTQALHHELGQRRGRAELFADYRLRIAEVTYDSHAPAEVVERRFDETVVGAAKACAIAEPLDPSGYAAFTDFVRPFTDAADSYADAADSYADAAGSDAARRDVARPHQAPEATGTAGAVPASAGPVGAERFDGVLEPHSPLLLTLWPDLLAARDGLPGRPGLRIRYGRVIRDYGRLDRREAPQYLPDPSPAAENASTSRHSATAT